jgi:phage protein D
MNMLRFQITNVRAAYDHCRTNAEAVLRSVSSCARTDPKVLDGLMARYDAISATADGYASIIGVLESTLALGVELPSVSALISTAAAWKAARDATSRAGLWDKVVDALAVVEQDAEKAAAVLEERRRSAESEAAQAETERKAAEARLAAAESKAAQAAAERKAAEDHLAAMKALEATPGPDEAAAVAKAAARRKVAEDHLAEMIARKATPWRCPLL